MTATATVTPALQVPMTWTQRASYSTWLHEAVVAESRAAVAVRAHPNPAAQRQLECATAEVRYVERRIREGA